MYAIIFLSIKKKIFFFIFFSFLQIFKMNKKEQEILKKFWDWKKRCNDYNCNESESESESDDENEED
jgi:hypothetical protein